MWDLTLTKTAALRTTKNIQSIQKKWQLSLKDFIMIISVIMGEFIKIIKI